MNLLVLGGSGFVGRSFCEHWLRAHGGAAQITVATRRLTHAQPLLPLPGLVVQQADVFDPAQLRRLLQGQDAVLNLIAVLHGSAARFEQVHAELPRRLAAACHDAGVRRLVHVSALGVTDGGGEAPSLYLRSKARGENSVRNSGLDWTLVRPSVIFGQDDRFLNLFAALQASWPLMPLAGGNARFQPVWVEDVAQALCRLLHRPAAIGETYELAGPRIWTLAELVRLAGRLSGQPRPLLPLPEALGWLQALALECLPGEPLMSRDNLRSMRLPNVASGRHPGLAELGIAAAELEAVAAGYLAPQTGPARLDPWRMRAGR